MVNVFQVGDYVKVGFAWDTRFHPSISSLRVDSLPRFSPRTARKPPAMHKRDLNGSSLQALVYRLLWYRNQFAMSASYNDPPALEVHVTRTYGPTVVSGLIIFTIVAAIGLSRPGTNIDYAISQLALFFNGQKFNSKSLLIITGLVCGTAYFCTRYIYLYAYADRIWDRYFARKNDQLYCYGLILMQVISTIILVLYPHYWYVNIAVFQIALLIIIKARFDDYLSELEKQGFEVRRRALSISKDGRPAEENPDYAPILTRAFLLRSGVRHLVVKGFLYDGLFFLMIATAHILRRFAADPFDLLFVGMYCATSILFTINAVVNNTIAGWIRLNILSEHAARNDFQYFSTFLR